MNKQMLQILSKLNPDLVFLDKSEYGEKQFKTVRQLIEEFTNNNIDDTSKYVLKTMPLNHGKTFKLYITVTVWDGAESLILFTEMDWENE